MAPVRSPGQSPRRWRSGSASWSAGSPGRRRRWSRRSGRSSSTASRPAQGPRRLALRHQRQGRPGRRHRRRVARPRRPPRPGIRSPPVDRRRRLHWLRCRRRAVVPRRPARPSRRPVCRRRGRRRRRVVTLYVLLRLGRPIAVASGRRRTVGPADVPRRCRLARRDRRRRRCARTSAADERRRRVGAQRDRAAAAGDDGSGRVRLVRPGRRAVAVRHAERRLLPHRHRAERPAGRRRRRGRCSSRAWSTSPSSSPTTSSSRCPTSRRWSPCRACPTRSAATSSATPSWQGVPLATLLDRAGVQAGATQIVGRSVDGFTAGFPTEVGLDGRTALVAVAMNGEPLPADHGFPARLVIAGLYGYVSATKWLDGIQLATWDDVDGYWIPRVGPRRARSRRRRASTCRGAGRRSTPARSRSPAWPGRRRAGSRASRCRSTTATWREAASATRPAATHGCSGSSMGADVRRAHHPGAGDRRLRHDADRGVGAAGAGRGDRLAPRSVRVR